MPFDVPFHSQYEGLTDPHWQWRGCGVVALKMVLDYWHALREADRTAPTEALLHAGLQAGAYREGIGWTHGGLVSLARSYGYEAFNKDFAGNGPTPRTVQESLRLMLDELVRGPVLASVYSGLDPERGGGHIVVLTGAQDELVFFNDPEQPDEREGRRTLAVRSFLKAFKRRYIVVIPTSR